MMIFWLVLSTSIGSTPLHVGNYPDLESCMTAANTARYVPNPNPGKPGGPTIGFVCVQANTGKPGNPQPPPG